MVGGIAVALLVLTLARDCSRPRFILIGIGVSWSPGGRGRHLYDHRRRTRRADGDDLAGGQPAGRHMAAAGGGFCWALPGAIILFCTARAADVALLGDRTAIGLGVRLQQLTVLRFFAPVLLTSASVSCVGSLGFVGLMAPHMARFVLRGGRCIAAVRQRADWRLAGAGDRYPWPAGVCPAADPGGDCHCPGGVPVLRYLALASP